MAEENDNMTGCCKPVLPLLKRAMSSMVEVMPNPLLLLLWVRFRAFLLVPFYEG